MTTTAATDEQKVSWYEIIWRLLRTVNGVGGKLSAVGTLAVKLINFDAREKRAEGQPTRNFYDRAFFPWLETIEANWQTIRDEVRALREDDGYMPYPERQIYDRDWKVLALYGWGVRLDKHCDQVPKTAALIAAIPGITNAGISRMAPETHILAHANGSPEGLLRLHIPLIIPEGCEFRVRDQKRPWVEGQCFVFDDCLEHEAWNPSKEYRTVLLVDFRADDLAHYPRRRYPVDDFFRRLRGKPITYRYEPQT